MARRTMDDEDWEEDWSDDSGDDEVFDQKSDDDEPTITCPYCGNEVHEDSPRCPSCENYLSQEDRPPDRKPLWFLIGAGLGLLVFLRWLFV